ncbi:MAG: hypothetical protein IT529_10180 [Burkholderiales bacterium]|nr:hypothetical protein [Burkholderiales bacterium]
MQLDLFTHGRDVMLQNDVIAALRGRDAARGQKALERFAAEFPDREMIPPLKILLATLAVPAIRIADRNKIFARIREIDAVVTPAAERVFGREEAANWLSPVWLSLANAAAGLTFHPECPRVHAAPLFLRSGDWAAAEVQIATIPSWRRIPMPLAWMAEAGFHRGGLESVWCLMVELAWIDSDTFHTLARRLKSRPLHRLLNDFEAGLGDEENLDPSWFPAWMLITAPEMASVMRQSQAGSGKTPERGARLIMELLALEKQGRHADLVAQRRKLRDLHPGLYKYYMSSR